MLYQFLNVLFQTLIHKSHNLLQEEIVNTIYHMASVEFSAFYTNFLPHFLQTAESLDSNQKTSLLQNFKRDTVSKHFLLSIAILNIFALLILLLFFLNVILM